MTFFDALKDKAVALSARALINRKIASFGEVTDVQIDIQRKTARLEVQLKGETDPISVEAGAYEVSVDGDQTFISFSQMRASREWLGIALNEYLSGRKFPVPSAVRAAL